MKQRPRIYYSESQKALMRERWRKGIRILWLRQGYWTERVRRPGDRERRGGTEKQRAYCRQRMGIKRKYKGRRNASSVALKMSQATAREKDGRPIG
ncbi:hypothetical protein C6T65_09565 [Burkholderia vietnamiensis]|uniref:Uncharacterized protein n=1 Tax=Burkholderia vietnamiensis TaxID=60552 RepID=A0AA44Y1I2_BURVI|nr:hypothetical protein C6T65_09565 [Burkholderia vietnamiensis]